MHHTHVFFEYAIPFIPSKTHMEPYQNMKVWNTWIFQACKTFGFLNFGRFFLWWISPPILYTKGRSRYGWFLTFRGGCRFCVFPLLFERRLIGCDMQRVHGVSSGCVLELIFFMIQLSKEHSNRLGKEHTQNWPQETTCLWRKFFHICFSGVPNRYVPGVW